MTGSQEMQLNVRAADPGQHDGVPVSGKEVVMEVRLKSWRYFLL